MLYRSSPESDVAYVFEATSNARLLGPDFGETISWSRFGGLAREADLLQPAAYKGHGRYKSFAEEFEALRASSEDMNRTWKRIRRDKPDTDRINAYTLIEIEHSEWEDEFQRRVFAVQNTKYLPLEQPSDFGPTTYVCGWRPRYKFEQPLKLATLKADPWLAKNWNALRANFIQMVFRTEPEVWEHVVQLAERSGNRGLKKTIEKLGGQGPSTDVMSERDLQNRLAANPAQIPGHDLELVGDGYLGVGREVSAGGGWIDLLGVDRKTGNYVVVELKAVRAGRNVVGQVMAYAGWVAENLADGSDVEALVISDGVDSHFASAASAIPNLRQVDISALDA